jgi:hypothetical protein
MIDWLSSKFALFIASLLILSSAFSVISIQRQSIEDFELEKIAEEIAARVNSMALVHGHLSILMKFEKNGHGETLPMKVKDDAYIINLTKTGVMVLQDKNRFMARFVKSVHLWYPDINHNNDVAIIEEMDLRHRHLQFESGMDFIVERKLGELEESHEYHTFIHKKQI